MRKPSISQLVYQKLYPRPKSNDPTSFSSHITRHLVPEVRIETHCFYGPLDCIEAQYPGLDYSFAPHRMRLGRFQYHRRLFRAFNELGLTADEISELCCWEGTKSARMRYERESGITVQDTTCDNVEREIPEIPTITVHDEWQEEELDLNQIPETGSDDTVRASNSRSSSVLSNYRAHEFDDDTSDEEVESCGVELNHRLLAAMAARDQGVDVPLDEDWEQWFKESGERGGYEEMVQAIRTNQPLNLMAVAEPPASVRHDTRANLAATTALAEDFLYSTSANAFTPNPVLPPATNPSTGTAR
ncbi:hypothetical protein N7495_005088 [Penicillium taxi]|uniref:uncharacterized protein n=1 Tax=Penicillium taxi TaxID=168475 RepID=UPI0025459439|nr:uncharacterized protein N7495_005088 [Penicillium taxi]KAJ5893397.1 hypothetical protein N7495_005088 [Penicillium taxi]